MSKYVINCLNKKALDISNILSLNTQPTGGENMNAKTIKSLYNGDYTCIEKPIVENSKYSKTLSKCTSLQEELMHLVDKETFSRIDNVLDCMNELSDIEAEESFIESFSLAISLMLEALSKK